MTIEWRPLQSQEIALLQSADTLYVFDLRGTNVLTSLKIPDFWKYENILPWILNGQHVAVNEDYIRLKYPQRNHYFVAAKKADPRISLTERLSSTQLQRFSKIWMGVPNRAADSLVKKRNISLNFSFAEFQDFNDKYKQKEILGELTPDWEKVHSQSEVATYLKQGTDWFLKRRHGSGGWHVLDLAITTVADIKTAFSRNTDWFLEKRVRGDVYSIQCLRLPGENKTIVFGFVRQLFDEGTHFIGGRILQLSEVTALQEQLERAIHRLDNLLQHYEGFYGIDFMVTHQKKLYVFEANVRMTDMTIPVLVANDVHKQFDFLEDIEMADIGASDVIMTEDLVRKAADVLREPQQN